MKKPLSSKRWIRWSKGLISGLLLFAAIEPAATANAETQETDIRVAMFLDLGSTYKSTTPAVTLQSSGSLSAGPGTNGDYNSWINIGANQQARFSINGYRLKVLQTSDFSTAAAAAKKLQATTNKPLLFIDEINGQTVYQLYTGVYASAAAANQAISAVSSTVSSLAGSMKPEVRGPHYLSAGVFSSAYDAEALRSQLAAKGMEAWKVLTGSSGSAPAYSVWIGEAESDSNLAAVKSEALAKQPYLQLSAVDASAEAVVVRSDVVNDLTKAVPVPYYELTGGGTFWLQADSNATTLVKERSGRKYRGGFEISTYNGQLAFVNELPMDQYLYSVVGAEVPSSWNQEALKAQAVAARSYALFQPKTKFKLAGLVDTTLSQVYSGISSEAASVVKAVDATSGEVLKSGGSVIEGIFSSNTGGMTADPTEVWGNASPVYAAVTSPEDKAAAASSKQWYHVLMANGQTGYVREDNAKLTGQTSTVGLSYMTATTNNTNVRVLPMVDSTIKPVGQMNPGDQAIVLEKVDESGSYSWVRGPFTSDQLLKTLKAKTATAISGPITSLIVSQRGPSGRAIQVKANGQVVKVSYPDAYRSAFGSLPSTLFDIVSTGRYTVQGADGQTGTSSAAAGTSVMSASGKSSTTGKSLVVMNGSGEARVVDQSNQFMFVGQGNGHGLGLSQWGAKGMADQGYDYTAILQHYYQNAMITKD